MSKIDVEKSSKYVGEIVTSRLPLQHARKPSSRTVKQLCENFWNLFSAGSDDFYEVN